MATAFEPSLSTSAIHAPFSSATAPSMADSLPNINFGFKELRDRMDSFTFRFDQFIERGRKRVLEEGNQFRINVAELQKDQHMRKRNIEIMTLKTATYAQTVAKESQETAEMHSAINNLTSQRDDRLAQRDALKQQIAEVQKDIAARRSAQQSHQRYLNQQSRFNMPELDFWQDYLCMRIEGAGAVDRLKFVFTHVCEADWEKEAWFELGTGSRDYQIFRCSPKLERRELEQLLDKLNEGRDLTPFLKGIRALFVQALK
ncbi:kinetochore protein Spc25 [Rhizodiscina lignyota]|uniref:Kinetochore protein SPC25 n=1 Tax=Rhizodiscina lignyota TaxID=1504668 RepID=A0A9P4MEQ9_9PEZI|nr:kinetochore protein Spc25 [Rhizodiscina lignyota]